MPLGIKEHFSPVMDATIYIVKAESTPVGRKQSSFPRDKRLFTWSEIEIMKGLPEAEIRAIGLIKDIWCDANVSEHSPISKGVFANQKIRWKPLNKQDSLF